MVEESGTLESQLEATKVSSLSVSGPAKTLHPTTASRRTWLQVGYKVGWPGTPLSLGLKQPRTSVILKSFLSLTIATRSSTGKGGGSFGPQYILFPWQVNPLICDCHTDASSSVEAAGCLQLHPIPTLPLQAALQVSGWGCGDRGGLLSRLSGPVTEARAPVPRIFAPSPPQRKHQEIRAMRSQLKKIEDLGAAMEEALILDNKYTEHSTVGLAQQWDQLDQLGMRMQHNLEQQIQAR